MDTHSYIVYIKTEDIYIDIAEDVEDLILQIMNQTYYCVKEKVKQQLN